MARRNSTTKASTYESVKLKWSLITQKAHQIFCHRTMTGKKCKFTLNCLMKSTLYYLRVNTYFARHFEAHIVLFLRFYPDAKC